MKVWITFVNCILVFLPSMHMSGLKSKNKDGWIDWKFYNLRPSIHHYCTITRCGLMSNWSECVYVCSKYKYILLHIIISHYKHIFSYTLNCHTFMEKTILSLITSPTLYKYSLFQKSISPKQTLTKLRLAICFQDLWIAIQSFCLFHLLNIFDQILQLHHGLQAGGSISLL